MNRIGRLANPQYLPLPDHEHVPLTQFQVLDALVDAKGPLRTTELARAAGLPPPELSRALAELETKGLIARTTDQDDGRVKLVSVTSRGAELIRLVHDQATSLPGASSGSAGLRLAARQLRGSRHDDGHHDHPHPDVNPGGGWISIGTSIRRSLTAIPVVRRASPTRARAIAPSAGNR